ncbi:MAG TPA: beta-galactosidase, partial [Opitutaceae bacterium]|nr:beta-galactosidase [Opitutaceae bacterium]
MRLLTLRVTGALLAAALSSVRGAGAASPAEPGLLALDASAPPPPAESGYLKMGGRNPAGVELGVNSRFLTRDGRPWIPVMGEFQYARYPRARWEEEIEKMKAGGVTVVATYVFWIYHEETEGKFDWSGDRDLGYFVDLCARHGLYCFARIGPWDHGEVRNGGFPDWLLAKCGPAVRQDAGPYLTYVKRYYGEVARQLRGRLWKEGGPVIGIQLDNELRNNPEHLLTLKRIATGLGLDVPYYTMTGWDRARVPPGGGILPLFGGYPDGFWIDGVAGWDQAGRKQYFFGLERDDSMVGDDLRKKPGMPDAAYLAHYPYGACEIGGGMEVSYRRRPVLGADDVAAEALVKLGSGSNLQGYYVYQGGADQIGALSPLNESRATGYPNDMPEISYDFQAPLGEYGQRRPTYDALRIQHLFLADFGGELAPLPAVSPAARPAAIGDHATLRWSVRSDGRRGFLFVNNYQHLDPLPDHDSVQFQVRLAGGELTLPRAPVRIRRNAYFVWPIHLPVGGADLVYATAQPLCRVGDCWVFFAQPGIPAEFVFDPATLAPGAPARRAGLDPGTGTLFKVAARDGTEARVLLLTALQAAQAWKANLWGQDRLFLSEDGLLFEGGRLRLQSRRWNMAFSVWPAPALALHGAPDGIFTRFNAFARSAPAEVHWRRTDPAGEAPPVRVDAKGAAYAPSDAAFEAAAGTWHVDIPADALKGGRQLYLSVDYVGDMARAYLGDRLVDDDFFS